MWRISLRKYRPGVSPGYAPDSSLRRHTRRTSTKLASPRISLFQYGGRRREEGAHFLQEVYVQVGQGTSRTPLARAALISYLLWQGRGPGPAPGHDQRPAGRPLPCTRQVRGLGVCSKGTIWYMLTKGWVRRRRFQRGLKRKPLALVKRLRKAKKVRSGCGSTMAHCNSGWRWDLPIAGTTCFDWR